MELVWLRGIEHVAVLALPRFLVGRHIRIPLSRMKFKVSSWRLYGRGGRGSDGPMRFVNNTVIGCSWMGELDSCVIRIGREMNVLRVSELMTDERDSRVECSGVRVGRRDLGSRPSIRICGTWGVAGLRKKREPL